jgi:hypothetical protein
MRTVKQHKWDAGARYKHVLCANDVLTGVCTHTSSLTGSPTSNPTSCKQC